MSLSVFRTKATFLVATAAVTLVACSASVGDGDPNGVESVGSDVTAGYKCGCDAPPANDHITVICSDTWFDGKTVGGLGYGAFSKTLYGASAEVCAIVLPTATCASAGLKDRQQIPTAGLNPTTPPTAAAFQSLTVTERVATCVEQHELTHACYTPPNLNSPNSCADEVGAFQSQLACLNQVAAVPFQTAVGPISIPSDNPIVEVTMNTTLAGLAINSCMLGPPAQTNAECVKQCMKNPNGSPSSYASYCAAVAALYPSCGGAPAAGSTCAGITTQPQVTYALSDGLDACQAYTYTATSLPPSGAEVVLTPQNAAGTMELNGFQCSTSATDPDNSCPVAVDVAAGATATVSVQVQASHGSVITATSGMSCGAGGLNTPGPITCTVSVAGAEDMQPTAYVHAEFGPAPAAAPPAPACATDPIDYPPAGAGNKCPYGTLQCACENSAGNLATNFSVCPPEGTASTVANGLVGCESTTGVSSGSGSGSGSGSSSGSGSGSSSGSGSGSGSGGSGGGSGVSSGSGSGSSSGSGSGSGSGSSSGATTHTAICECPSYSGNTTTWYPLDIGEVSCANATCPYVTCYVASCS